MSRPFLSRHLGLLLVALRGCQRTQEETALYREAVRLEQKGEIPRATMKCRRAFKSILLRTQLGHSRRHPGPSP